MIQVSSENHGMVFFKCYDELFKHICEVENKVVSEIGLLSWSFTVYSNKDLTRSLMNAVKAMDIIFTEKEHEAYDKRLSLVEIYKGNPDEPHQIILTDDVDVNELMRVWCHEYGKEHGLEITELASID